ncbi:helicase associated domain-containing protein [Streptomyces avidinii]|uniref:helicase associated domain-containing protein n=1 Tax=Streptomyces avidinii TaxID=1895 RepID=UPI00386CF526|nr:helicase associated domain-containing protein [Streptomyces avidinii]
MTRHGEDIGRWLATQRRNWDRLNDEQQGRLDELSVKKAPRTRKTTAKPATAHGPRAGSEAFQKSLQALHQYIAREGTAARIPRSHVEVVPYDGKDVEVRLGVWRSNMRSRQAALPLEQRKQLTDLGLLD